MRDTVCCRGAVGFLLNSAEEPYGEARLIHLGFFIVLFVCLLFFGGGIVVGKVLMLKIYKVQ